MVLKGRFALLAVIFLLTELTGCAKITGSEQKNVTKPDPAEAKLAEAATLISHSLVSLAEIQQAATPPHPDYEPPDPASYGMSDLVSVDWSGPVEQVVMQIANATGYRLRVIGNKPNVAPMVTIAARNRQIGDILRDISFQSRNKTNIIVFPKTKVIELRYVDTA